MTQIIPKPENLAQLVFLIRGEKVLLDSDLADLYDVATKVLNQAVKRNIDRFPADFMFQLSPEEWEGMRSQFVTSSRRKITALPYAFTEQGVAMLSSVLRSQRSVCARELVQLLEQAATLGIDHVLPISQRLVCNHELVVLCDVSGSVANFAQFTLLLVFALRDQFTKVRAFTFIDHVHEVTHHFRPGADVVDVDCRFFSAADLPQHFGVYLWPAWQQTDIAVQIFSAAVCAQLLHYGAVLAWLPRALGDDDKPVLRWDARFAAIVVACAIGMALHFAVDFAGARVVYAIPAAVHAWLELPVLLAALAMPSVGVGVTSRGGPAAAQGRN